MGVLFGWGASPDPSLQGSEERKPTETGTTLELLVATSRGHTTRITPVVRVFRSADSASATIAADASGG
jgi:hypothetical protein